MKEKSQKKILGLRANVFWLGLVSLFNDFSSQMIYSVMPAFLVGVLGAPAFFVGLIDGFADALASFLKIYFGWVSDKTHKRKFIAIMGYALSTSTRWILALAGNFWQVFILRAVDRAGKGMRDAPRDALISESVEKSEIGKSFGFNRAMDALGGTLGPLAAVLILPVIMNDYRLLFKIAFAVGILSLLSFIFIKDIKKKFGAELPAAKYFGFSLKNYSREFKHYILSIFIFGLGVMPVTLLLLKSSNLSMGLKSIPLMYFVYSLSFVLFAVPIGKLSDKLGERKILIGGFLAAIGSYLILALNSGVFGIAAGFVVFGLYSAMTDGIERALASRLVPEEKLAAGQGFLNAAVGISSLIAGVAAGAIWTSYGPVQAIFYGITLMIMGLFIFINLNGSNKA